MELNRRRKPLSNITNILPVSTLIKPKSNDTNTTSIGSNKTENPRTRSHTLSSLHRLKSVDIFVDGACDKGTKNTRFELDKEHPDRNKLHKEQIGVSLSKSSIVPRQESTRSKNSENSRSQSQACTPERLKSPADFDDVDFDGSKTKTVYSRRQGMIRRKNKVVFVRLRPASFVIQRAKSEGGDSGDGCPHSDDDSVHEFGGYTGRKYKVGKVFDLAEWPDIGVYDKLDNLTKGRRTWMKFNMNQLQWMPSIDLSPIEHKLRSNIWQKFKKVKGNNGEQWAFCNLCNKRFT
ncbi:hypothetical protein IFM89_038576, partial [Coptis chinensis]